MIVTEYEKTITVDGELAAHLDAIDLYHHELEGCASSECCKEINQVIEHAAELEKEHPHDMMYDWTETAKDEDGTRTITVYYASFYPGKSR